MRALSLFRLASLLLLLLPLSRASAQATIRVEWKQAQLSVDAENASLSEVLQSVSSETGVQFLGLDKLHCRISQHFSNLSLTQGLQLLLSGVDYAVSGDFSRPDIARVFVFERPAVSPESDQTNPQLSNASADDKHTATPVQKAKAGQRKNVVQQQEAALRRDISSADPASQTAAFETLYRWDHQRAVAALLDAAKSADSGTRSQALQLLVGARYADPATTLSVLHDALNDQDGAVRGFAIQSLANLGGKQAMEYLREAFGDPNPAMRLMIISSVGPNLDARALLRAATSDPDETVRSTAAQLLQQAEKQER